MNKELLAIARGLIRKGDKELNLALDSVVKKAVLALDAGVYSVMDKTAVPPSGDKHDYMSMGPYWWPDPSKEDGLPYIRIDGKKNPESQGGKSDFLQLEKMAEAVETLVLAFHFTGMMAYAHHAACLLRTWFLHPNTSMKPHLRYAQVIPGKTGKRGIGIIDTVRFLDVINAVELLGDSGVWLPSEQAALQKWFQAYLKWLMTSPYGKNEARQHNNHGTWYDAQIAGYALFVGDVDTASRVLEACGHKRLMTQVSPDGRQPYELARNLAFDYSCFNLEGIMALAQLGEPLGIDLWHFQVAGRDVIRSALDYLAPFADSAQHWPHPQLAAADRTRLLPLLRQGYQVYQETHYLDAIQALQHEGRNHDVSQLICPAAVV